MIAPRDVAPEQIAVLENAFRTLSESPEFIQQAEELGVFLRYMDAQEFKQMILDTTRIVEDYRQLF